jgi:hypothetical protein
MRALEVGPDGPALPFPACVWAVFYIQPAWDSHLRLGCHTGYQWSARAGRPVPPPPPHSLFVQGSRARSTPHPFLQVDAFTVNNIRGANYTYEDYAGEFQGYATALRHVPGCPLIQGATYYTPFDNFTTQLPDYVGRFKSGVKKSTSPACPPMQCRQQHFSSQLVSISVPSGFLVEVEKPNGSPFTFT